MSSVSFDIANLSQEELRKKIDWYLRYALGLSSRKASEPEMYQALSYSVREMLIEGMIATEEKYRELDAKRVYYLSMEYLLGRSLENNLCCLGLLETCRSTVSQMGFAWRRVIEAEPDAALGNGGLGRLAACLLDSMATRGIPVFGYGINYQYGLFRQEIIDGWQREFPDHWLENGNPWAISRSEEDCYIPLYGTVEHGTEPNGEYNPMWLDWKVVIGSPSDIPIVGYGGRTVNYLRLYRAKSSRQFDMRIFNLGDYLKAVEQKVTSETISKVLYPSDMVPAGRELRLVQEYFLSACAVRDIVRRYRERRTDFEDFSSKVAIQLNDTHPTLVVADLMRLLVDENDIPWEKAWQITRETIGYTNHTLLPEALEKWPLDLLWNVIPRHTQIILEINRRFLARVEQIWPKNPQQQRKMSIIEEGPNKQVRMAHLAMAGSHSVNGVAKLHSELIRKNLAPDFARMWPEKFNNKTNGVTPRRWLRLANPRLSELIDSKIGEEWTTDLGQLRQLEAFAEDRDFQDRFLEAKLENKKDLTEIVFKTTGIELDPGSLFSIHVKRIHEYKRQLLNVLHIILRYLNLVEYGERPPLPRTWIFAGKAAPGYEIAKRIIKLINNVSRTINNDERCEGLLKVAFVPDYRVSLAERIIPAADLSEQISTAGMEASGTGNMKFAMNGALTIGTLDGANIEIRKEVGENNIFIFGLTAEQIASHRFAGSYSPRDIYRNNSHVQRVLDSLCNDVFCPEEPGLFRWVKHALVDEGDRYFLLADLDAYIEAQKKAERLFVKRPHWAEKAILNVARIDAFSSDRTAVQYAKDIWNAPILDP